MPAISAAIAGAAAISGALGGAAGIGAAAGVVGAAGGLYANYKGMQAGKEAAAEQQKAEGLRAAQMRLEAERTRRSTIRQSMMARAAGLNAVSASGSEVASDSSAYGGLLGQSTSNLAYDINAINQNEAIGGGIFAANAAYSASKGEQDYYSGMGSIFNKLGDPKTAGAFGRVGSALSNGNPWQASIFRDI